MQQPFTRNKLHGRRCNPQVLFLYNYIEVIDLHKANISHFLLKEYNILRRILEGKAVKRILGYTEDHVALLMEDGTIVRFLHLEDELILDVEFANQICSP